MGAAIGLVGAATSIGSALFGGGSTASSVAQAPSVYQPTGQAYGDAAVQSGIAGQQSVVPQANQTVQNLYNNPGASGMQAGATVAGGLGEAAGVGQFVQGQNLVNQGNSVVPYAYSALNAGFDPQKAMYNQQFQQNTDQTRAGLEARGIDSTVYGAGVESDSNRKFNTDWGFNQLSRQAQGASTAEGLLNTASSDITQGSNLSGQASGTYMAGASLPYNTNQTIGTNQLSAISQGQGIQQTPINNWMSYLGLGQSAASTGTQQQQTNLDQNQQGWNQNQQLGKNLGSGIQGLSKGWQSYAGGSGGGGTAGTINYGGQSWPSFG